MDTGTLISKHFYQADHSIGNTKCVAVDKVHSEKHTPETMVLD